ncbi:acyl-ACP desaturase, partial [Mycobacterium tuberculosis]|nr:acyl-ACP desaturase [Mycobacterium tuberculosis]
YDLRQHLEEVIQPVMRKWNVFDRDDFSAEGEQTREELAAFLEQLEKDTIKFEEMRDRALAREAKKRERQAS